MTRLRLVIGTRNSALARAQTDIVVNRLRAARPDVEAVIHPIITEGDRSQKDNTPLQQIAGQGVFVKELERALLQGDIDIAVHSLKDMTTEMEHGLTIGAILDREDPRDVLIARDGATLVSLPKGARVGTSSARRTAQLGRVRPDIEFLPIRGNVDTRVRRLSEGEYDAIVLAAAGLHRLGLHDRVTHYLPAEICLPDPGQGALAVQSRTSDARTNDLLAPLNHKPTHAAVMAERAFLGALGGGCAIPIGALATLDGSTLTLRGMIATPDGSRILRAAAAGPASEPDALGRALADKFLALGATSLLPNIPAA